LLDDNYILASGSDAEFKALKVGDRITIRGRFSAFYPNMDQNQMWLNEAEFVEMIELAPEVAE
jgi:hypothetical protein